MKRIVFFTGAGMSKESGLPTFRGEGGMWNELDVEKVASARSWYCGVVRTAKKNVKPCLTSSILSDVLY